jgi:hypothetical protein
VLNSKLEILKLRIKIELTSVDEFLLLCLHRICVSFGDVSTHGGPCSFHVVFPLRVEDKTEGLSGSAGLTHLEYGGLSLLVFC